MASSNVKKIVLAYSGGLDTSVILKWLQETYKAEIVAFIADIGQGEELEPAREKAIKTGACATYVEDLREEFARDFVFPTMKANAFYEGTYMLGTSVALTRDKPLKLRYGIPEENKVGVALIVGYPAVEFRRAIRRRLACVKYVD